MNSIYVKVLRTTGDAGRGIHKGAAPVRELRADSAPCAGFFSFFSCRNKKRTYNHIR